MNLPRDEMEALLRNALPPMHKERAGAIADLIRSRMERGSATPPADHSLALALNSLRGQQLTGEGVQLGFDGVQAGDITIDTIAGRDSIRTTINVVLLPSQFTPHMQFQRRLLLERVRQTCLQEIPEPLETTAPINITLAWYTEAIPSTARSASSTTLKASLALPEIGRAIDAFIAAGRSLIVLGAPGSGKTTLLLEICRELLLRAEQDEAEPIPVVLKLATWAASQKPLQHWMIDTLTARPYLLPRDLSETLVAENKLIPLLDGLDEVDAPYRNTCVAAVNAYLDHHFTAIALTAREDDYATLTSKLNLRRAVQLRPLDDAQIAQALMSRGMVGIQLYEAAEEDKNLRDLLRTPLILELATQAQVSREVLSTEARTVPSLLSTYIRVMLQYRQVTTPDEYVLTLRWLRWVARRLYKDHEPAFYLEHLQPSHIRRGLTAAIYRGSFLVLRIILLVVMPILAILIPAWLGLLVTSLVAPATSVPPVVLPGIVAACALVIIYGAIFVFTTGSSRDEPIRVVVTLRWSPPAIWQAMREQLQMFAGLRQLRIIGALGFATVMLLTCSLFSRPEDARSILMSLAGLAIGMPVALVANAVLQGVIDSDVTRLQRPNQGLTNSIRTGLLVWVGVTTLLFLVALATLATSLVQQPAGGAAATIIVVAAISVWFGLIPAAAFGWLAVLKHVAVRLTLWLSGDLPGRLEAFLDSCVDRALLRRTNSGYTFIHGLLQECIAGLSDAEISQLASEADRRVLK